MRAAAGAGDAPHESVTRGAAMLVASLVLFASVFALALLVEEPNSGILHLHAVPIAILALHLGILAGLSAAAFSMSLMFVWAEMESAELLLIDYMSGAVPFLLVVVLCQIAIRRTSSAAATTKDRLLMDRLRRQPAKELSEREKQVLGLLALGHTNKEVAEKLFLSVRTVESHRARIQSKLLISTRAELVRHALDRDLVEFQ